MVQKHWITIVIILATLLAGIGSIISEFNKSLGIILISIGVLATIYQIISQTIESTSLKQMIDIQSTLLASSEAGNVYKNIFEKDLTQKGKSSRGIVLLKKAYSLNKNDVEVAGLLAGTLALRLSFRDWVRGKKTDDMLNNKDWIMAKEIAERSLKLNPKQHMPLDALGMLYDTIGKHERARDFFIRSSKLRFDPYWHFFIATSWGLSGNNRKEVQEIEKAIKEGATGWFTDLSYGAALSHNGQPTEALKYLGRASQARGMHPMNSYASLYARATLSYFSPRSLLDLAYLIILLFSSEGWHSFSRIVSLSSLVALSTVDSISRSILTLTSRNRILERLHYRFGSPPVIGAFHLGWKTMRDKDYETAIRFFKISLAICPKSIPVLANLSMCQALLGNRDQALETLEKALALSPENKRLQWNRDQIASGVKLNPRYD